MLLLPVPHLTYVTPFLLPSYAEQFFSFFVLREAVIEERVSLVEMYLKVIDMYILGM